MRPLATLTAVTLMLGSWLAAEPAAAEVRPSDGSITIWVNEALRHDPRVIAANVKVETDQGILTLSGVVSSLTAKKYADLEAKRTKGVLGVINELRVEPEHRSDDSIQQDVRHRLTTSQFIHSQGLDVKVKDGAVTLMGKVDSWAESNWAELLAGEVRGVKSVHNQLGVEYFPGRPDQEIADDVVAAIARDVYLTGLPITATVLDGVVTLTGSVGNAFQKERAGHDAFAVDNVQDVKDDLKVEWWEQRGVRKKLPTPSDGDLEENVRQELDQDTRIDPTKIYLDATHGNVTLRGSVPTYLQRTVAGQDAKEVVGVVSVVNQLTVAAQPRADSDIQADVVSEINSDYLLHGQDIGVQVSHAVVTLTGNVNEPYEKAHATEVVSRVRGVKSVVNQIQVNSAPKYTDAELQQRITDRLQHDDETRWVANQIEVKVHNGRATLTGMVSYWSERDEAQRVASSTDGIESVDNQIHVLN